MANFAYLLEKIYNAEFRDDPFRHIYIENFFSQTDFDAIIACPEVSVPAQENTAEVIRNLESHGYEAISFPGCTTNSKEYIRWHEEKGRKAATHSATEGFGMAFRLASTSSLLLRELNQFFSSDQFLQAVSEKLEIDLSRCRSDTGLQKYLDGYEISPHPDVRSKAATYMININPDPHSEDKDQHTLYLEFVESRRYVEALWRVNPIWEREWVPWEWCRKVQTQSENNSAVFFSPSDNSMHAVRLDYDHTRYQRTQFYGNLWFRDVQSKSLTWEDLDIIGRRQREDTRFKKTLRANLKRVLRKIG